MKVSELITQLQNSLTQSGDGEVYMDVEYTYVKVGGIEHMSLQSGVLPGTIIITYACSSLPTPQELIDALDN